MIPTKLRKLYYKFRKMFFTRDRPDGPFFGVDADKDRVEKVLGMYHFGPSWTLSYKFRGENVNLARVEYDYDGVTDIRWWQVHVRGWQGDDGLMYLRGHYEPEPTEYPSEHLDGEGYDLERGMMELYRVLEHSDIRIVERVADKLDL